MQFTTTVAALALPILALAAPAPATDATASTQKYLLKAHIPKPAHSSSHSKFEGKYVELYHTGAGTNDVQFSTRNNATTAYINGTSHQLEFITPGGGQQIPYTALLPTNVQYTAWQAVEANIGNLAGYGYFYLDHQGLQWTSTEYGKGGVGGPSEEFGGWLICDWWHSVPQLFWLNKFYVQEGAKISDNCEVAQLIPQDV